MPSFLDLPRELLLAICAECNRADLTSLALSCRQTTELAVLMLWRRKLRESDITEYWEAIDVMQKIQDHGKLVGYLVALSMDLPSSGQFDWNISIPIRKLALQRIMGCADAFFVEAGVARSQWHRNLMAGNRGASTALLVASLPNLHSLVTDYRSIDRFMLAVLTVMSRPIAEGGFNSLRVLKLRTSPIRVQRNSECRISPHEFYRIACLPSLRALSLNFLKGEDTDEWVRAPHSSVVSLSIWACSLPSRAAVNFVGWFKALEEFHCQMARFRDVSGTPYLEPIKQELEKHAPTLKVLRLIRCGHMRGGLQALTNLEVLTISLSTWLRSDKLSAHAQSKLVDLIPASLRDVHFEHDGELWSTTAELSMLDAFLHGFDSAVGSAFPRFRVMTGLRDWRTDGRLPDFLTFMAWYNPATYCDNRWTYFR